jgi:hypothetical protein
MKILEEKLIIYQVKESPFVNRRDNNNKRSRTCNMRSLVNRGQVGA